MTEDQSSNDANVLTVSSHTGLKQDVVSSIWIWFIFISNNSIELFSNGTNNQFDCRKRNEISM